MNKAQILKLFYSKLNPLMASYGYKKNADNWYKRKLKIGGWFTFFLFEHNRENGYCFGPKVAVRLELVESIYHQVSKVAAFAHKDTFTLHTPIAEYIDSGGHEGSIIVIRSSYIEEFVDKNATQIDEVVQSMYNYFEKYGLEYFSKIDTYQSVDFLLNSQPDKPSLFNIMNPDRIMRGLIVAWLVQNPNFEKLIEIYTEALIPAPDHFTQTLNDLVKYLRENITPLTDYRIE